ncbi:MAG: peptidoglycan bridge formation glycyltransferase FemA/FemB family protein [Cocleimonas sp.]
MINTNIDLNNDIYYQNEYSSLYAVDGGELFTFKYVQGDYEIVFSSIKRAIKSVSGISVEQEYYDLETPYGYGGPLTNCYDEDFLKDAFSAYRQECIAQNIVCEFIRFHPFNRFCQQTKFFDFHAQERQVVIVDLSLATDERWARYSKNTRNILRKANKKLAGLKCEESLDAFCKLYQLTMDKNNASDFFYFKKEYFERLSNIEGVELLAVELESTTVSAGFFMYGKDIAHYHLSANNSDYFKENGNYALLDFAFEQAKNRGCKWMMLGGGRSSDENDSLFKFKSKFSGQYLPFFIGGLTFLPEIKDKLNEMWQQENPDSELNLFQLYRHS